MSIELKNYACVMCNGQTKDFKIQNKKFQLLFSNCGIGGSEISFWILKSPEILNIRLLC